MVTRKIGEFFVIYYKKLKRIEEFVKSKGLFGEEKV